MNPTTDNKQFKVNPEIDGKDFKESQYVAYLLLHNDETIVTGVGYRGDIGPTRDEITGEAVFKAGGCWVPREHVQYATIRPNPHYKPEE